MNLCDALTPKRYMNGDIIIKEVIFKKWLIKKAKNLRQFETFIVKTQILSHSCDAFSCKLLFTIINLPNWKCFNID